MPSDAKCVEAQYVDLGTGDGLFSVTNSYQDGQLDTIMHSMMEMIYGFVELFTSELNDIASLSKRKGIQGKAKCPSDTGDCFVSFFNKPFPTKSNYNVIDTDYDNYSVVYSCWPLAQYEFVWILSRNPQLDQISQQKALDTISKKLPTFDKEARFDGLTYQGDQCTYAK